MRRAVTLEEGIAAAEDLASALLGVSVHKAIDPLSPSGFLLIGKRVAERLEKAVKGAEAAVIADVIHSLGFDWKKLTPAAADVAMKAVNKAIGDAYAKRVLPKINDTLEVEGPKVMKGTKASVKARQKIEIATDLAQRDFAAEKAIRQSHVNFIRYSTGDRAEALSKKARSMVATGLSQGLGTDQIGRDLQAFFRENIPRPPSYWRTVADAYVGRARATSQIYAYESAKIQSFEVVAVIDEVTTDQCRYMNGKVFSVNVGRALIDTMNALEDPEDVKYAAPWIRKGRDSDGGMRLFVPHSDGSTTTIAKVERSGVGRADDAGKFSGGKDSDGLAKLGVSLPPYHGRCRTVIVAGAETFEEGAPIMVPGADLDSTPLQTTEPDPVRAPPEAAPEEALVSAPPAPEAPAEPFAVAPAAPAWMNAEVLDVVESKSLSEGMMGATRLTIKDADGNLHQGVWKTAEAELAAEREHGVIRDGIKAGTYYQREAATFEVDRLMGGSTVVPPTVTQYHGENGGSLQAFVEGASNNIDWKKHGSSHRYIDKATAAKLAEDDDVRRLFLLDVITSNDDRHSGNIMWRNVDGKMKPVAIDNGLTFPSGSPCRFLFAVGDPAFEKAMLALDVSSVEKLNRLDLPTVAKTLKGYMDIGPTAIENTLGRIKSLQKNPQQLAEMDGDPSYVVEKWLTRGLPQRAMMKELTNEEVSEIKKLAR